MVTRIEMPKFGLSMEEGTIAAWLVKVGDTVKKGDELAEINSEKLTNTVEAPVDGVVRKLLLEEDESAPCGALICLMADTAGEDISDAAGPADLQPKAPAPEQAPAPQTAPTPTTSPQEVKITPRAKRMAEQQGLEYAHITGSGIGGAITIDDLKKYGRPKAAADPIPAAPEVSQAPAPIAPAPVSAPDPVYAVARTGEETVKMSPMQSTICRSMFASMITSAQTTLTTEANVQNLTKVYRSIKPKYTAAGIKLSYTAMIIKAVAMALEHHPIIRAQLVDGNHYKICSQIDIGIAVDIPNGLIVPVIRQANLKDLRTICTELSDLTARAKRNALTQEDLGGAVTTITNLGMFGITYFTPVLNAPESTILGVGAIIKKPVECDGGIHLSPVMSLSLTHDHRVSNGAPCARYLQEIVVGLQDFRWI